MTVYAVSKVFDFGGSMENTNIEKITDTLIKAMRHIIEREEGDKTYSNYVLSTPDFGKIFIKDKSSFKSNEIFKYGYIITKHTVD